jgi:hypothetical protein
VSATGRASRSQIQGEVRRLWIPAKLAYGETAEEWQASNSVMLVMAACRLAE